MNIPFNGAVTYRLLLKRYSKQIFYRVKTDNVKSPHWQVRACKLTGCQHFGTLEHPEIHDLDVANRTKCSWDELFLTYAEASVEAKRRNALYDGFKRKPYIPWQVLDSHKITLLLIEKSIEDNLKYSENFDGIDFTDVSAGGIQIRGHHKDVSGFTYGDQITINYDFSNKDEVADDFVSMWKSCDTKARVQQYNSFLEQGMKYGWN